MYRVIAHSNKLSSFVIMDMKNCMAAQNLPLYSLKIDGCHLFLTLEYI